MAKPSFDNLSENIVFTKVKTKKEALELKDKAKEKVIKGKNVVIFFRNRHLLQFAPGQDPYQVRKDIEAFLSQSTSQPKKKSASRKSTPQWNQVRKS